MSRGASRRSHSNSGHHRSRSSRQRSHSRSRSRSRSRDVKRRRQNRSNSRERENRNNRKRYRSNSYERKRGRSRSRSLSSHSRSSNRSPSSGSSSSASSASSKKSLDKRTVAKSEEENNHATDAPSDNFPKAAVTEANGEISCSIEESNRIRAMLGLKPLVVKKLSQEAEAVSNFKEQQKKEQENDLKEKLQIAKEKRLARQKLQGPTLADLEVENDDVLSAAAWVQRSRIKEAENKQKADMLKIQEEEKEKQEKLKYDSKDLRGLSVKHGDEDFDVGEEVILTLADSSILNHGEDGRLIGVNSEGDILENVNLAEKDRRIEREKMIKRIHQPVYAGYDDAEFAEGAVIGVKPSILPQYDKEVKAGPKLVLSDGGVAVAAKANVPSVDDGSSTRKLQSLNVELKEMSDYLTPTEFATFNKPKKEKKKRKIRKKDTNLIEELEASLEVDGQENSTGGDRGKRGDGVSQLQMMRIEESERRQAYDLAVKSADAQSKIIQTKSRPPPTPVQEEDDDAEMAESLARARRLALQLQKKNASMDVTMDMAEAKEDVAYEVAARVRTAEQKFPKNERQHEDGVVLGLDDPDALDAEGRKRDGTLVFTSTTEFTTRLQARLQEKARSRAEAAMKDMNVSGSESENDETEKDVAPRITKKRTKKVVKPPPRKSGWVDLGNGDMEVVNEWEESKGQGEEVEEEDIQEEEQGEEETDEQMAFLHRQPLVATGMAATLQLLKGSGDLKHKEELAGRAKDPREQDTSDKDYGVNIEYRDKLGRKLTQKEAFRQLSYRFHGFGPGTKKKEKKMRELQASQQLSSSRAGISVDKGTMRTLTKAQEGTGKAYITLQGGVSSADAAAQLAATVAKKAAKLAREKQHEK